MDIRLLKQKFDAAKDKTIARYKQVKEALWRARIIYESVPKWIRIAVIVLSLGVSGYYLLSYDNEYQVLYTQYYEYYYRAFSKIYPEDIAEHSADQYADYYARYFTSDQYRRSLKYSLPEDNAKNLSYPSGPVAGLSITGEGLQLIKNFEGLKTEPYKDYGGKMTIGYGHMIRRGEAFSVITDQQAETMLLHDIALAEAIVKRHVRTQLSANQFSALVSLVYNIGEGQFRESTLLKYVNQRQFDLAIIEFDRWNYVNGDTVDGLTRRRKAEAAMFSG